MPFALSLPFDKLRTIGSCSSEGLSPNGYEIAARSSSIASP